LAFIKADLCLKFYVEAAIGGKVVDAVFRFVQHRRIM